MQYRKRRINFANITFSLTAYLRTEEFRVKKISTGFFLRNQTAETATHKREKIKQKKYKNVKAASKEKATAASVSDNKRYAIFDDLLDDFGTHRSNR